MERGNGLPGIVGRKKERDEVDVGEIEEAAVQPVNSKSLSTRTRPGKCKQKKD
jgi:hypothetical protein